MSITPVSVVHEQLDRVEAQDHRFGQLKVSHLQDLRKNLMEKGEYSFQWSVLITTRCKELYEIARTNANWALQIREEHRYAHLNRQQNLAGEADQAERVKIFDRANALYMNLFGHYVLYESRATHIVLDDSINLQ